MSDEQINAAIAEVCGRRRNPKGGWYPDNGWEFGTQGILNYCNDLNAMHEAEKMLAPRSWNNYSEKWWNYNRNLACISDGRAIHATARERAEAFLRTLGKWEEATDKESLTVQTATTEQSSVDHLRDATKMMEAQP